jgi:enoyl-[acyl-carrier protein] reductase I
MEYLRIEKHVINASINHIDPIQAIDRFHINAVIIADDQIAAVIDRAKQEFGTLDFLVHSIAYAPLEDLKGDTTMCSREGFRIAMETSAYSLLAVGRLARPILAPDASILTLTYFGGE